MPERCDICGVAALESEPFAEESLPFRGTRRYCPACRQRLHRRVFAVVALVPLFLGCAGVFEALHRHLSLLESAPVQGCLVLLFQWLMILPHELGHAAAGRAFGFQQIRIVIGAGKPLFSFQLFGLPTQVNLIPFGGVTLSRPPAPLRRWHYLVFAGAGLLVNLTAAAISGGAAPELFSLHSGSLATPFFWANVVVLAENLLPHRTQAPYGSLGSDGLQLWNVLFRWNKPLQLEPARLPAWVIALRHLLKWTAFLLMVVAMLFWALLATFPFLDRDGSSGWGIKLLLPALMLPLAYVTGWAAVRIAKYPVATAAHPTLPGAPNRPHSQ